MFRSDRELAIASATLNAWFKRKGACRPRYTAFTVWSAFKPASIDL